MPADKVDVCILICAGAEWRAFYPHFQDVQLQPSPYGECFGITLANQRVQCLHTHWGKVAAAGATQYAIDRWSPDRIINLGTCGGIQGRVCVDAIILVERTIVYDIMDKMTDADGAIERFSTIADLTWLPEILPQPVTRGTIVSADRDLRSEDIPELVQKHHASVADWESGAIAWVAQRNRLPFLILCGVSDLVNSNAGEAYDNYDLFEARCQPIMEDFANHLPDWLQVFKDASHRNFGS